MSLQANKASVAAPDPTHSRTGWLQDLKVLEFESVGPVPYCGLMLAQMGAQVTRVVSPAPRDLGVRNVASADIGQWHRQAVPLNLKQPADVARALDLAAQADVLIEGYRPGVMERLGLGPTACLARQARLIYARLTGWGQQGPWAQVAGHDINFIAMSGVLGTIGPADGPPSPPLNLVGDLAGGSYYLLTQILAALHARQRSGQGEVIDAAMVDGCLHLLSATFARLGAGTWQDQRGANVLDGGCPWYRCYRCADGGWMAVGAIEQRFFDALVQVLKLKPDTLPDRHDRGQWPALARRLARRFRSRSRAHWEAMFAEVQACVTPVLTLSEAQAHPMHAARGRLEVRAGMLVQGFGVRGGS